MCSSLFFFLPARASSSHLAQTPPSTRPHKGSALCRYTFSRTVASSSSKPSQTVLFRRLISPRRLGTLRASPRFNPVSGSNLREHRVGRRFPRLGRGRMAGVPDCSAEQSSPFTARLPSLFGNMVSVWFLGTGPRHGCREQTCFGTRTPALDNHRNTCRQLCNVGFLPLSSPSG